MNYVTENKKFWKTIKLLFTEKKKTTNNIILTENNQTVMEDKAICQIFNAYFTNVTKGLKLQQVDESQSFENEESCRLIRENYGGESFSFKSISKDDIIEAVKKITFKQSINIKRHTNYNNKEFCYLLL